MSKIQLSLPPTITTNDHKARAIRRSSLSAHRVLFAIAAAVVVVDQASKYWVVSISGVTPNAYPPWGGFVIVPGFFNIVHTTNTGAAWGMFAGFGTWLAWLAAAALVAIFWFRDLLELQKPFMQVTFGFLCGGILGNLIDRVIHGKVIDFLDFILVSYRWPTFNLADSAICVGTAFYLIGNLVLTGRGQREVEPSPPS